MLFRSTKVLIFLFAIASLPPQDVTAQRFEVEEIFFSAGLSTGTNNRRLNEDISIIGDLDGDGIRELVAAYRGGSKVWILFLDEEGKVRDYVEYNLDTFPDLRVDADADSRIAIGSSMTELDDLDKDGIPEVLITMAGQDLGDIASMGGLLVLFMNADGSFKRYQVIDTDEGNFDGSLFPYALNPALTIGSSFGSSAAILSDLDGDGIREIAVGAQQDSPLGGDSNGAIFILFLNEDGTVKKHHKIGFETGDMGEFLLLSRSFFGSDIAYMGDMNNDGLIELVVSAMGGLTTNNLGAVYLFSIDEEGAVVHRQKFDYTDGYFEGHHSVGQGVDNVGDLNGDGIDELAVSADSPSGTVGATVYLMYFGEELTVKHILSFDAFSLNHATRPSWKDFAESITTYHELRPQGEPLIYVGGEKGIFRYENIDFPPSIDSLHVEEGPHTSSDSVSIAVDFFDGDGDQVSAFLDWGVSSVGNDTIRLNQVNETRFEGMIPAGPSSTFVVGKVQLIDQDSLVTISEEFRYRVLPDTPDSLTASLNEMQPELTWNRTPGSFLSYQLYRAKGDSDFVSLNLNGYGSTKYTDRDVQPGNIYRYRVTAYNESGESPPSNEVEVYIPEATSSDSHAKESSERVIVSPGFPNPFSTTVAFTLKTQEVTTVHVVLFDQLGREVEHVFEGVLAPGSQRIVWEAGGVSPGVYMVQFKLNDHIVYKPVIKQ